MGNKYCLGAKERRLKEGISRLGVRLENVSFVEKSSLAILFQGGVQVAHQPRDVSDADPILNWLSLIWVRKRFGDLHVIACMGAYSEHQSYRSFK